MKATNRAVLELLQRAVPKLKDVPGSILEDGLSSLSSAIRQVGAGCDADSSGVAPVEYLAFCVLQRALSRSAGPLDAGSSAESLRRTRNPRVPLNRLEAFLTTRDIGSYVDLCMALGSGASGPVAGRPLGRFVSDEIRALVESVAADLPTFPCFGFAGVDKNRVPLHVRAREEQKRLLTQTVAGRAVWLFDRRYHPFVIRALEGAKKNIEVTMFLFALSKDAGHPSRQLLAALIARQRAGVSVRVLLDADRATDPYGSRFVNAPAVRALRNARVAVRRDLPEVLTHSKVVVIDGELAILGSHNWTDGSFSRYDDTSVAIKSVGTARMERAVFESRWRAAGTQAGGGRNGN